MPMIVAATSVLDQKIFVGLVEGFAGLGSVVGVVSALCAFLGLVAGNSADDIGRGINYGVAVGFVPGLILGGFIFIAAANNL